MDVQHHIACMVPNGGVGVGSDVVEELMDGFGGVSSCLGLLGTKRPKSRKEGKSNCPRIVQACTHDFLDSLYA